MSRARSRSSSDGVGQLIRRLAVGAGTLVVGLGAFAGCGGPPAVAGHSASGCGSNCQNAGHVGKPPPSRPGCSARCQHAGALGHAKPPGGGPSNHGCASLCQNAGVTGTTTAAMPQTGTNSAPSRPGCSSRCQNAGAGGIIKLPPGDLSNPGCSSSCQNAGATGTTTPTTPQPGSTTGSASSSTDGQP